MSNNEIAAGNGTMRGFASDFAIDARERRLFRSLDTDNDRRVRRSELTRMLAEAGLSASDARLRESMTALDAYVRAIEEDREPLPEPEIPEDGFCRAIRSNILLIERALQGSMVIPDFASFCREIDRLYAASRGNRDGSPADYIPQLDLDEPEVDQFGLALCTVDGQRHAVGEADVFFPVESACKPINYCLALEEHGPDVVHRHIGHEPSGASFNELALDGSGRPHNPMINAGAIMSSALVGLRDARRLRRQGGDGMGARGTAGVRFDYVMERWQALCGGDKPRFSTEVYLSERETADRNFALAYYMRENKAFPPDVDLHDVLDFYFQSCAIELTAEMASVVAATLANGGICPISGERVFATETVQRCLSMMSSSGMYDFSGEFAFSIGLPAKSGVSGIIMVVVPNVMGFCTWSPRLDSHGNSVRGLDFCHRLIETFNFHSYDILTGTSDKSDPRVSRLELKARTVNELIWAASKGDLGAFQDHILKGADPGCVDYDLRTPLHLAAAENQIAVVRFFIERARAGDPDGAIDLNPRDRWGGTPLDDAYLHGCDDVIALLEAAGGVRGTSGPGEAGQTAPAFNGTKGESRQTAELIWAASQGNLVAVRRLVAQGVPLALADYDLRTPLHLAAAEGRAEVVEYFVTNGVDPAPRDRWGNTPLDEAVRHGHDDVAEALRRTEGPIAANDFGFPDPAARDTG
jgi:glutaminase